MGCDFDINVEVSRAELSLGSLTLSPDNGYHIARDGIGPGDAQWRRISVESPYTSGRFLTHAVRDTQTVPLNLRVVGATNIQVFDRIHTLSAAFSQFQYTMLVTIDGVDFNWICEPADMTVGDSGAFTDLTLRSHQIKVGLSIPRKPD